MSDVTSAAATTSSIEVQQVTSLRAVASLLGADNLPVILVGLWRCHSQRHFAEQATPAAYDPGSTRRRLCLWIAVHVLCC